MNRSSRLFISIAPVLFAFLAIFALSSQSAFGAGGICEYPFGDINQDKVVDWSDLGLMADQWLQSSGSSDLDGSGSIDLIDYALLAADWGAMGNCSPVVDAGIDQTVNSNDANLAGVVTDDGLPNPPAAVTINWTKQSGPDTVTFANANIASTKATFSQSGVYVLRLTAGDGATTTFDEVTITVNATPINQAPVVNVGSDQSVTLPTNANFAGTVTDDGLPNPPAAVTVTWTKQSGAGTVTFGNANAATTTASFSAAGTYVLRLTASDGALSAYDEVSIIVSAPAGPDWSESADYYVAASGSDSNPGSSSQPWATIAKAVNTVTAGKKVLVWSGTYGGALTFSNSGTSASPITFKHDPAADEAIIDGGGATNGTVYSTKAKYIVIDGFTIRNGKYGIYTFSNLVTDWTIKNCRITANSLHGVYIRSGINFSLFNDAVYVNGNTSTGIYFYSTATNNNVTQCSVYKQKYGIEYDSGSSGIVTNSVVTKAVTYGIYNRSTSTITVNYSDVWSSGTNYQDCTAGAGCIIADPKFAAPDGGDFHLGAGSPCIGTALDSGDMGYRYIVINHKPQVSAGLDQTIVNPVNSANLDGTVTDDGQPNPPGAVTTTWTKQSGPGTVTFGNASAVDTTAAFSAFGTYVLRLTASDSELTAYDEVTITYSNVTPQNQAPAANAGADFTATMPDTGLHGTVTDDGLPNPPGAVTVTWTKQSGPGTVTFADANSAVTTATFSQTGTYVLRLTANDSALSSHDDVTVTVNPEPTFTYEGYAPLTTGGSGGKVVHVTTLADSGAGSLRAAVDGLDGTPTTIKFDVGGTIDLSQYLYIIHPYVTIAGETAPSPGITLNGAGNASGTANIQLNTHDVIIRHVRSRANAGGRELIQVVGDYNIIIDHVSCSDGGDGAIDINGGTYNITVSWCILANTSEAHRSYGKHASLHHNLYHGNNRRQPKIVTQQGPYDWRNNVMEAWTGTGTNIECMTVCANIVNIINNYYGPNTNDKGSGSEFHIEAGTWDIYIAGNRLPDGDPDINLLGDRSTPNEEPAVTTSVADDNFRTLVRGHAGAMPRDAYDTAIAGAALP